MTIGELSTPHGALGTGTKAVIRGNKGSSFNSTRCIRNTSSELSPALSNFLSTPHGALGT